MSTNDVSKDATETRAESGSSKKFSKRPKNNAVEVYRISVDLVRALAWPLMALLVLLVFQTPFREILSQIPNKLSAATKVAVGSLSLEIQAQASGNPTLASKLGKLSPEAVKFLIQHGRSRMMLVSSGGQFKSAENFSPDDFLIFTRDFPAVRELNKNGMLTFREDLEQFIAWLESDRFKLIKRKDDWIIKPRTPLSSEEIERLSGQYYTLSDLGQAAWNAVLDAILEQLRVSKESGSKTDNGAPTE